MARRRVEGIPDHVFPPSLLCMLRAIAKQSSRSPEILDCSVASAQNCFAILSRVPRSDASLFDPGLMVLPAMRSIVRRRCFASPHHEGLAADLILRSIAISDASRRSHRARHSLSPPRSQCSRVNAKQTSSLRKQRSQGMVLTCIKRSHPKRVDKKSLRSIADFAAEHAFQGVL